MCCSFLESDKSMALEEFAALTSPYIAAMLSDLLTRNHTARIQFLHGTPKAYQRLFGYVGALPKHIERNIAPRRLNKGKTSPRIREFTTRAHDRAVKTTPKGGTKGNGSSNILIIFLTTRRSIL